jgi:flagellar biosynthetic protein FliO
MKSTQRVFIAHLVLNTHIASSFGNTLDGEATSLTSLMIPLTLILGAAAAATWFLRRWKGSLGRSEGPMQLVHVIALGQRERLALVKIGSRHLVIGVTPTSISRVAQLDDIPQDSQERALSARADAPRPLAQGESPAG